MIAFGPENSLRDRLTAHTASITAATPTDLTVSTLWGLTGGTGTFPGARKIFVGGAGTITVQRFADAAGVRYTVPAGAMLEGQFTNVGAVGDTATLIIAEF